MLNENVVICGGGAWGLALAKAFEINAKITVLARSKENSKNRLDTLKTRTVKFNITEDTGILKNAALVIIAIPTQKMREFFESHANLINTSIILASKGIELSTGKLPLDIAKEFVNKPIFALSGPNFAKEVLMGLPAAATLAGENLVEANKLANDLTSKTLRLYGWDDVVGVEVAGALKNIFAIACGMAQGKGLGQNTTAAVITRGLQEMIRYGKHLGANNDTFYTLAGVGDLALTCTSTESRNFEFGMRIGRGMSVKEALKQSRGVVEGYYSTKALLQKTNDGLYLPISRAVYRVLYQDLCLDDAIHDLLSQKRNHKEL